MDYRAICYEKENNIAKISLNKPDVMNSLVQEMIDELIVAAKDASEDENIRAVILTGKGKAFCAGGDINRFSEGFTQTSCIDYVEHIHNFVRTWVGMPKPTIAMVNGPAVGAGLSLAVMCDLIIASDKAKFGSAFVNMGLIPDLAAVYFLPRIIGITKAREMMYTGKMISAEEAREIGLANHIYSSDQLEPMTMKLAEMLYNGPTLAIRNTKKMLSLSMDMDFNSVLGTEAIAQSVCMLSEESSEAVSAFLEKRKPEFH